MKISLDCLENVNKAFIFAQKFRTDMEDIVKEWLRESDYKDVCHGRVLLSDLFVDFVHWCGGKKYDIRGITSRWLASILSELGYEKIRRGDGVVFVVGK